MNHRRWSGMLPRHADDPTSSSSSSFLLLLSLAGYIPVWFSLLPYPTRSAFLFLSGCAVRLCAFMRVLGFTYLGHSSSTMSLCRYFRQRACLGELSHSLSLSLSFSRVRLPPLRRGYGARSESRSKSHGKQHFRIVSCAN
jgi:hypothetical protein